MIGEFILKHRASIGILLLAITAYFGYGVSKLTIATSLSISSRATIHTSGYIMTMADTAALRR